LFSGLVETVGTVRELRATAAGLEITVAVSFDTLAPGDSIAVNGVCLTVRQHAADSFTAAAGDMTLSRTIIADWEVGTRVNVERALRADSRLGGHIVQGHVDGSGTVIDVQARPDISLVSVRVPPAVAELLVPLGSIALDGVSLTVNELPAPDVAQVALVEYTRSHTTLGDLQPGQLVHVEADVIGKYVRHLLEPYIRRL
jgi:riboflavin synthase